VGSVVPFYSGNGEAELHRWRAGMPLRDLIVGGVALGIGSVRTHVRARDSRTPAPRRGRGAGAELETLGAVSGGAAVGDGAGGLFGGWRCVELPAARSCAQPGVSLGRGWVARDYRSGMPAVFLARAVEWARSDFEGAALRALESAGESRGGCEGMVLVSRLDADAFLPPRALQVSAGGVPLCAAGGGKCTALEARTGV
jgi:hypothetical protein